MLTPRLWDECQPAVASRLADGYILVVRVAYLATVAMHSARTLRVSPEGSLSRA